MELRLLKYFLAVAREQNITRAANSLHLTQPTLSRQLTELEDEIGKKLLIRGRRKVTLTEDGMLFRKRAEEITDLVEKTKLELQPKDNKVRGNIFIGSAETDAIRYVLQIAKDLKNKYPKINYQISSGDKTDISEQLDKGLIDFGILMGNIDKAKYNYIELPLKDRFGILMKKDSELAKLDKISPDDMYNLPLIVSRQSYSKEFSEWLGKDFDSLNICATYSLLYNASLMVEEELGYALCIDKIINTTGNSNLCFIPLDPAFEINVSFVWKKFQVFSEPAKLFLEELQNTTSQIKT